jgi:uncharacterized protein involved in exopolysaccharide biosynthesis
MDPEVAVDVTPREPPRQRTRSWLALIERRRGPLAAAAVAGALAGVLVASVVPPWYRASARLVIVPADDPTASGGPNPLDVATATLPVAVAVLHSERVAEATVAQLRLDYAWHLPPREAARRLLARLEVRPERKTSLLSVSIEDGVAARASAIVAAVTDLAATASNELWSARNHEQRQRLERDLGEVRRRLEAAEEQMRRFRERTHVVDLSTQVKASLDEAATLERLRVDKALALRFARDYGNGSAIEVQRSRRELAAVSRELETLRHDRSRPGPLLTLDLLPALEVEDARLRRDVETLGARYELLSQKLNQLKAADARPAGRAETIDPAVAPLRRAGPSRLRFGGGGAVLAALAAALLVLLRAQRRSRPLLS